MTHRLGIDTDLLRYRISFLPDTCLVPVCVICCMMAYPLSWDLAIPPHTANPCNGVSPATPVPSLKRHAACDECSKSSTGNPSGRSWY